MTDTENWVKASENTKPLTLVHLYSGGEKNHHRCQEENCFTYWHFRKFTETDFIIIII